MRGKDAQTKDPSSLLLRGSTPRADTETTRERGETSSKGGVDQPCAEGLLERHTRQPAHGDVCRIDPEVKTQPRLVSLFQFQYLCFFSLKNRISCS